MGCVGECAGAAGSTTAQTSHCRATRRHTLTLPLHSLELHTILLWNLALILSTQQRQSKLSSFEPLRICRLNLKQKTDTNDLSTLRFNALSNDLILGIFQNFNR